MTEQRTESQNIDTYPNKVVAQLEASYNKAGLTIVGERAGQVLRGRDMGPLYPRYPFVKEDLAQATASLEFGARLVHVTEGLLIPSARKGERYIGGVSVHDYQNIPAIVHSLAKNEGEKSSVAIRNVFGGTTSMQLRSLSMLAVLSQQMEKLTSHPSEKVTAPIPPQGQVIFANHIASFIRGLSYEQMAEESRQFVDIAEAFIEEFYPSVVGHIVFLEDAPVEDGSYIKEEMERLKIVAEQTLPAELKQKIASKRSAEGNGNSLMYAAAHLLMHDTNNPELLLSVHTNKADATIPSTIISLGGKPEADFCDTRFALREAAGSEYQIPTVQLFTKHKVPPYSPADKGDIALSDVFKRDGLDPHLVHGLDPLAVNDLIFLYAVTEDKGSMGEFIEKYRERFVV